MWCVCVRARARERGREGEREGGVERSMTGPPLDGFSDGPASGRAANFWKWRRCRGTSLIRNRPPPYDHHRARGIGLL